MSVDLERTCDEFKEVRSGRKVLVCYVIKYLCVYVEEKQTIIISAKIDIILLRSLAFFFTTNTGFLRFLQDVRWRSP